MRGRSPRAGALSDGLLLALGTLTVLRVPHPLRVDRDVARVAMLAAPLAGVVPGAALAGIGAIGAALHAPPLLAAVLGVGAVGWLSRGLHLDGLADTSDGLASGYDRARSLAVMRTGDVGPAGASVLLVVLLGQSAAVAGLVTAHGLAGALAAGLAVALSRGVLVICCAAGVPAARGDGLGVAMAGSVPPVAGAAALGCLGLLSALALAPTALSWWAGPAALIGGVAAGALLLRRCLRRLGGVTGDVLGACVEVTLTAALAVLTVTA